MEIYLFLMNALGFFLMLLDKFLAKKNFRRIPEKTLLLTAFLGGSLGAATGMCLARHKTRHGIFRLGLPTLVILHALILVIAQNR